MKRSSRQPKLTPRTAALKPWTREKLYFRGDDYFRELLKDIRGAKKSVDFESYIFESGGLGDQVLGALLSAHRRGVKVRLLVDGVGSPDFASHYGPRLRQAGLPYKVYRSWPIFFSTAFRILWFSPIGDGFRKVQTLFNGGKHRDHRKLCLIDNQKVWIGSFNVSSWHIEKIKGAKAWRDTGVRLTGVTSLVFRVAFLIAWEDPWPLRRRRKYRALLKNWVAQDAAGSPIRITITRKMRILFRRELLDRFQKARKRIWVLAPYFSPTHSLLQAMADAARRGCDVRLILPGFSDVPIARWSAINFYPVLLRAGCRIYEYQKSVLHGKTLFIDSWVMTGSSNLDQRSLRKDLEVNVLPLEKESARDLEKQFGRDLLQSREITLEDMKRRPLWSRFLSWFFFRFKSWF